MHFVPELRSTISAKIKMLIIVVLTALATQAAGQTFYGDSEAGSSGDGSLASPFKEFSSCVNAAAAVASGRIGRPTSPSANA